MMSQKIIAVALSRIITDKIIKAVAFMILSNHTLVLPSLLRLRMKQKILSRIITDNVMIAVAPLSDDNMAKLYERNV